MHHVAPSRALARRSRHWLTVAFVIVAIGVFVLLAGIAMFVIELVSSSSPNYGTFLAARLATVIGGILILLLGAGLGIRAVTLKTDNITAERVGNHLGTTGAFDNRFHYIRNINKPQVGYLDAVLIGPPGVLVFRIINRAGNYANETSNWLRKDTNGQWVSAGIDPTREVVADVKHVREYLTQQQLADVPVYGVVVLMGEAPQVTFTAKEPVVPPTTLRTFFEVLRPNYLAKDRLSPEQITKTAQLLYET